MARTAPLASIAATTSAGEALAAGVAEEANTPGAGVAVSDATATVVTAADGGGEGADWHPANKIPNKYHRTMRTSEQLYHQIRWDSPFVHEKGCYLSLQNVDLQQALRHAQKLGYKVSLRDG